MDEWARESSINTQVVGMEPLTCHVTGSEFGKGRLTQPNIVLVEAGPITVNPRLRSRRLEIMR